MKYLSKYRRLYPGNSETGRDKCLSFVLHVISRYPLKSLFVLGRYKKNCASFLYVLEERLPTFSFDAIEELKDNNLYLVVLTIFIPFLFEQMRITSWFPITYRLRWTLHGFILPWMVHVFTILTKCSTWILQDVLNFLVYLKKNQNILYSKYTNNALQFQKNLMVNILLQ